MDRTMHQCNRAVKSHNPLIPHLEENGNSVHIFFQVFRFTFTTRWLFTLLTVNFPAPFTLRCINFIPIYGFFEFFSATSFCFIRAFVCSSRHRAMKRSNIGTSESFNLFSRVHSNAFPSASKNRSNPVHA